MMQDLRPNTELKKQTVNQFYNRDVDTTKGTLTKKSMDKKPSKDSKDFAKNYASMLNGSSKSRVFDENLNELSPSGQEVLDYVSARTGGKSTVKPLLSDNPYYAPGTGGLVDFKDPSTAYVNPDFEGQDYILAHELAHSQASTPVNRKYMENVLRHGDPFDEDKHPMSEGYDRFAGSTFRHIFESVYAPRMIEEANAQGTAVGAMRGLGRPVKDPIYKDPRDYPIGIAKGGLDYIDAREGTFMDMKKDPYTGEDLGKKDVFGHTVYPQLSLPASFHRPELYDLKERIEKNIPMRVTRQFKRGIESMK